MRRSTFEQTLGLICTNDYIRHAVKRAGLSGITWHSLRHYHASTLLSAGVSPGLVAERLGHDIQTLMQTYAHVIRSDDDRVRAVIDERLGVSAEDFLRTEGLRGVPYIGPNLREPCETTSTPRSKRGVLATCGFSAKWPLNCVKTYVSLRALARLYAASRGLFAA